METQKPWYLSRTIWASLVAAGASIAALAGWTFGERESAELAEAIFQSVTAIAALVAVLGRLVATKRIN